MRETSLKSCNLLRFGLVWKVKGEVRKMEVNTKGHDLFFVKSIEAKKNNNFRNLDSCLQLVVYFLAIRKPKILLKLITKKEDKSENETCQLPNGPLWMRIMGSLLVLQQKIAMTKAEILGS